MGTPIIKKVVSGADIDPSLSGLYIEKDAVPEVQEFLRNAVGEETCFLGTCWKNSSDKEARQEASRLLQQVNLFCTPAVLKIPRATEKDNDTFSIISKSSIQSTLRYIRTLSDGFTYSASEVEKARKNPYLDSQYFTDTNRRYPDGSRSRCYDIRSAQTCKNEIAWIFTGRLICE